MAKRALHQHAVNPASELEADGAQKSCALKSQGGVHADRTDVVRIPDHGNHLAETGGFGIKKQSGNKSFADPLASYIVSHVDAVFGCEAVSAAISKLRIVGVSKDARGVGRNKIGPSVVDDLTETGDHLLKARGCFFERAGPVQDMMCVNRLNIQDVVEGCCPNVHRLFIKPA